MSPLSAVNQRDNPFTGIPIIRGSLCGVAFSMVRALCLRENKYLADEIGTIIVLFIRIFKNIVIPIFYLNKSMSENKSKHSTQSLKDLF